MLSSLSRAVNKSQISSCAWKIQQLRSFSTKLGSERAGTLHSYAGSNFRNGAGRNMMKRRMQSTASKDKAALGVLTPTSAALFMATGVGLYFYFKWEKSKQAEAREAAREARSFGRPAIGGPFELLRAPSSPDAGKKSKTPEDPVPFTDKDLLGKWTLLYFGFTNCPDICPAEMDKMGDVLAATEPSMGPIIQPVFVTVDPARDTPSQIAAYLQDFHPKFIGLHGTHEKIKAACKAYRVYFSTPPDADPEGDYLVDHSIFIYLLDPKGEFVEAFGQAVEKEAVVERIQKEVKSWESEFGKKA